MMGKRKMPYRMLKDKRIFIKMNSFFAIFWTLLFHDGKKSNNFSASIGDNLGPINVKFVKYLVICNLLLLSSLTIAQSPAEKLRFAIQAHEEGDYYSAANYYSELVSADSTNLELLNKLAECYRRSMDYPNAEICYRIIAKQDFEGKYGESMYWLGMMQKSQAKYELASTSFEIYYERKKKDNSYFSERARMEIAQCIKASKAKEDSLAVLILHLDKNINTPNSEFAPRQLSDSILTYSSIRPNINTEKADLFTPIYSSRIYEAPAALIGWGASRIVKSEANPSIQEGNASFNSDYTRMYFTRCQDFNRSSIQCEIYYCDRNEKGWSAPVKLDKNINRLGFTATQPYFCQWDEKTDVLFFVSDRPGGQGSLDVWYAFSKDKGITFDMPINLGAKINSVDNEITPFFDVRKKVLYLSSDGHEGLGNFDVFYSAEKKGKFSALTNIGYPINSSYNDLYFSVNPNDSDGFFVSNRPGIYYEKSATCCYDIFSYEWLKPKKELKKDSLLPTAKHDTTVEDRIKALLPLTLYFHNDEPNPKTTNTTSTLDYEQTLVAYKELKGKYEKEYARGLKDEERDKAQKDIDDFFVNYVDNGFTKLNQFCKLLLQELDTGRLVKIRVKGFCSPLATSEYNEYLAKRRIHSMVLYLSHYGNGAVAKYINSAQPNGGRLIIIEEPLGEEKVNVGVSDNPNDERNSIYSRAAALERNIKILFYESE